MSVHAVLILQAYILYSMSATEEGLQTWCAWRRKGGIEGLLSRGGCGVAAEGCQVPLPQASPPLLQG